LNNPWSDNINIPLSKLITPNNPGLSDEDKEKLRPNNQEFKSDFFSDKNKNISQNMIEF
jgi:hypothetical protein